MEIIVFDSDFTVKTAKCISEAILKYNNNCTIGLSGGSTPKPIYIELANLLYGLSVTAYQVDERITREEERLNQKMIEDAFDGVIKIVKIPIDTSIEDSVYEYNQNLPEKINIILLGMGTDGHTASLFPMNNTYKKYIQHPKRVIGMYVEQQKENRVSLNVNYIKKSDKLFLIIRGHKKMELLNKISKLEVNQSNLLQYPILNFLNKITVIMDGELN